MRARRIAVRVLPPLLLLIVVLAVWEALVAITDVRPSILPAPSDVFSSLWHNRTLLLDNARVTVEEIALGYLLAIVVGVCLAVLVSSSRHVERAVYPWLVVSQMIPIVAIAPIIVIWTGFDIRPKLIVIALVSFFPIAVNTIDGIQATEPELLRLLRTLGAGRWKRFTAAQFPSALPFLFSGLKVAAALAVIGAVFAEWVGSSAGLGYLILTLNNQLATADMFAAIVVLALIGIALFGLVQLLERVAMPWRRAERRGA
ncbi:MAG TPA: ABC transporter permease [Conexibacter sp.]|jgi:ABC-type nitrate/sulfonate/bicarbonate transport system permease component